MQRCALDRDEPGATAALQRSLPLHLPQGKEYQVVV